MIPPEVLHGPVSDETFQKAEAHMNGRMYPDDGGLKEPVRPFERTFGFGVLDKFRMANITRLQGSASRYDNEFRRYRIPRLFYAAHREDGTGGHVRLFGDRPGKGWTVYTYHNQTGSALGWAMHRVWNFCLFAIHHIGPGKATDPGGWHITWASLRFEKSYRGFAVTWQLADTFRTRKR